MQFFLFLLGGVFLLIGMVLTGLSFLLPAESKDEGAETDRAEDGHWAEAAEAGRLGRPQGWKHADGWSGGYLWEPRRERNKSEPGSLTDASDPSFIDEPLAENFQLD